MLYNANRGTNTPAKSGRDLIPLSIDSLEVIEPLTEEDRDNLISKYAKYLKN